MVVLLRMSAITRFGVLVSAYSRASDCFNSFQLRSKLYRFERSANSTAKSCQATIGILNPSHCDNRYILSNCILDSDFYHCQQQFGELLPSLCLLHPNVTTLISCILLSFDLRLIYAFTSKNLINTVLGLSPTSISGSLPDNNRL